MTQFRNRFSIPLMLLLVGLSACSPAANNPANPPTGTTGSGEKAVVTSLKFVKATTTETQIPVGSSGEAILHIEVESGYHVNANPPTYAYLKATELIVQPADAIKVSFITYPTATIKKFSFADNPLAVYEGDVPIKVVLKAPATTVKGSHSIPAKLNVQACDDQVCYAPGTLDLSIPVTIK